MEPDNNLTTNSRDYVLALAGDTYAIYLPFGGTTQLDLRGERGAFEVRWFNPRSGGALQRGSVNIVSGGGTVSIGSPPNSQSSDWVALVQTVDAPENQPPQVSAGRDAVVTLPEISTNLEGRRLGR